MRTPRRRVQAFRLTLVVGAFLLAHAGCATGSSGIHAPPGTPPPASAASAAQPSARATASGLPAEASFDRAPTGYATRLVIPYLDVDLPVIEGRVDGEGNPLFPLCDVAEYLAYYVQPGASGATYIYGHAQRGMLAPLLEASAIEGEPLLGQAIVVFTTGGWRHEYSISLVKRHATDYSIADNVAPDKHRLIVQTSEGPVGDPNKVQVAARPVSTERATPDEVATSPQPRECDPGSE